MTKWWDGLRKRYVTLGTFMIFWESLENDLQGINYTIKHLFREGNQVVDWLAQHGESENSCRFINQRELPQWLRGAICLDKLGYPHLHK